MTASLRLFASQKDASFNAAYDDVHGFLRDNRDEGGPLVVITHDEWKAVEAILTTLYASQLESRQRIAALEKLLGIEVSDGRRKTRAGGQGRGAKGHTPGHPIQRGPARVSAGRRKALHD